MPNLNIPAILTDLAHVGASGLPFNHAPYFQNELEICREWGFKLTIANDRVILDYDQDQLVPYWLQRETPAIAWDWLRVTGFLRVESTNIQALEQARLGAPSGTLICAEEQTAGKGRKGRSWFSPAKAGLYFTLIVRPQQSRKFWPLLAHVASIALVESLRDLYVQKVISHPLNPDIKWPNDVLLSGKKCAGILLEALPAEESSQAAVIGVGINVHRGSIPPDLAHEAACLDEIAYAIVPRRQLLVSYLRHFQISYLAFEQGKNSDVLDRWKGYSSMWDGVQIWIEEDGIRRIAETCGLSEVGALLVRTAEGTVETLLAGDIRIRRAQESPNL